MSLNEQEEQKLDAIEEIAFKKLGFSRLEETGILNMDWHECFVTSVKEALSEAYQAGRKSVKTENSNDLGSLDQEIPNIE
jgi:hypothetical protein